jgi:hypothetical protein
MKAYGGSGGLNTLILNLATGRDRSASHPGRFFPDRKSPRGTAASESQPQNHLWNYGSDTRIHKEVTQITFVKQLTVNSSSNQRFPLVFKVDITSCFLLQRK